MKRLCIILLCVGTLLTSLSAGTALAKDAQPEWVALYREQLLKSTKAAQEGISAQVTDINDDGIPELLVFQEYPMLGGYLKEFYTIENGKMTAFQKDDSHTYFPYFRYYTDKATGQQRIIADVADGCIQPNITVREVSIDFSTHRVSSRDIITIDTQGSINGVPASQKEAFEAYHQLMDGLEAIPGKGCYSMEHYLIRTWVNEQGMYTPYAEATQNVNDMFYDLSRNYVYASDVSLRENGHVLLQKGETTRLHGQVLPEQATDKTLIWSSSAPDIASVDQDGRVTAHKAGQTEISAGIRNKKYHTGRSVALTVTDPQAEKKSWKILYRDFLLQNGWLMFQETTRGISACLYDINQDAEPELILLERGYGNAETIFAIFTVKSGALLRYFTEESCLNTCEYSSYSCSQLYQSYQSEKGGALRYLETGREADGEWPDTLKEYQFNHDTLEIRENVLYSADEHHYYINGRYVYDEDLYLKEKKSLQKNFQLVGDGFPNPAQKRERWVTILPKREDYDDPVPITRREYEKRVKSLFAVYGGSQETATTKQPEGSTLRETNPISKTWSETAPINGTSGAVESVSSAPPTRDIAQPALWSALLASAGAGLLTLYLRRLRKSRTRNARPYML